MRKTTSKVLSLILTLAMVFSMMPLSAFAEGVDSGEALGTSATPTSIIAFDPEPYHNPEDPGTTHIVVDKNTAEEDIPLPMTLPATVEGGEVNDYSVAVEKWESADYDAATPGVYSFSPVPALLENESIAEGAVLPVVEVVVTANEGFMATDAIADYTLFFKNGANGWSLYEGDTPTEYTGNGGNGGGKWSVSGNTLTLNGFEFETSAAVGLTTTSNSTITLTNSNSITSRHNDGTGSLETRGIHSSYNLTINGTGSLTATGGTASGIRDSVGIRGGDTLTIADSAQVTAVGGTILGSGESSGILTSVKDKLVINGGTVTAVGNTRAIHNGYPISDYTVPAGYKYYVSTTTTPSTTELTGNGSSTTINSTHKYAKIDAIADYNLVFTNGANGWSLYAGDTTTEYTGNVGKWTVDGNNLKLDGFEFETSAAEIGRAHV